MTREDQIKAQCKVVAELSRNLAEVYDAHAAFLHPSIAESVGRRSKHLMEVLGDILNGMDAVSDDDEWMNDVFERAHEMFPEVTR
jgi:CRISPR/Cas system CSM-associated protein Csm2 small subunit